MSKKLVDAERLARKAHRGQMYGEYDYFNHHVKGVEQMCVDLFGPHVPTQITALLHDTVEDSDVSCDEISEMFGDDVSDAVYHLTKQSGESRDSYIRRCKLNPMARDVKIADTLFNLTASVACGDIKRIRKYASQLTSLYK